MLTTRTGSASLNGSTALCLQVSLLGWSVLWSSSLGVEMFSSEGPWKRVRILAGVIVLPLIIVLVLAGSAFRIRDNNREAEQQREAIRRQQELALQVQCTSARSDQLTLAALADLERKLGVPVDFVIPEVPPECE